MKKNRIIFFSLIFVFLVSIGCIYLINLKSKAENNQNLHLVNIGENKKSEDYINLEKNKTQQDLINISECSEEFMQNYFEGTKEINEKDNKDNILIVTSKEKIKNTFGASDIVSAPNNQYILQYNSEDEKNNALDQLKKNEDILYVEENNTYTFFESEYNSWGIEKMGLNSAIQAAQQENINDLLNDVTVAVIDSGCDMELFNENYSGKISETYNLYDGSNMYDGLGHGTHIAGTIAEGTSSNIKIFPVKVSNSRSFDTVTIITAVNYITYYKKADVINMSFGSTDFDNSLYVAIESASKNGIISVAAAGNDNTSDIHYPSGFDNTIAVSAVDLQLNLAEFSNYGETITFTAPGVEIESINGLMSGTSMSTPHVVCAVAMLKSANKDLTLEQITTLLKNTAIDLGEPGWDEYYGYGLINLSDFDNVVTETENTNIVDFEVEDTSEIQAEYGNITNLMNLKIILKDANGNEYIKYFSDIDDLEIENYDPFAKGDQNINIKYNNIKKTITVNNGTFGGDCDAYTCRYIDKEQLTVAIFDIDNNAPKKVYIPEYIDEYKVISIYEGSFKDTEIDSIILPSSVTSIGNEAFYNSTIKSITGGPSEISIGEKAFYNAYKLEKFEPKISELGEYAFYNASSINNLKLSDTMDTIESYTFTNCVSLENINIPNGLVEIKDEAFADTKIKNLTIPATLVNISQTAFRGMTDLETIEVDVNNSIYDSRKDCNALIETSSNTIILGASNTIIPDTVCNIGAYAFYNNTKLEKIDTNKVLTIKESAFEGCANLKEFYLSESVESLSDNALCNLPNVTVYMFNTIYQDDLMHNHKVKRAICIIPRTTDVVSYDKYRIFGKADDIEINISYYGFISGDSDISLKETITDGYKITYENGGDCFKYGDTYFTVSAITKYGISIEQKVNVVLEKAIPEYTIPTGLEAKVGQTLSDITLPNGFEWMDDTQIIEGTGNVIYKAKYVPTDTKNYEIVKNIDIEINVISEEKDETIKKGDTNKDGMINVNDIIYGGKGFTKGTLTAEEKEIGNVNGDSIFNINDLIKIMKFIVGKISTLD